MKTKIMKNKTIISAVIPAAVGLLIIGGTALAATTGNGNGRWDRNGKAPGVFGTVSSVSGTNLSVTSKGFGPNATETTYAVDAANATVMKNGATSTLSSVATGDRVMITGTVNGTSVTASVIRDGVPQGRGPESQGPKTPPFQGNGEPVLGGSVSAINGTTFTVTNKSNVTYTVDASSAKVVKGNATSSLSDVAVGDGVMVQGTVNGTSVNASLIVDQGAPRVPSANGSATPPASNEGFVGRIFGGIGNFFGNLFGF